MRPVMTLVRTTFSKRKVLVGCRALRKLGGGPNRLKAMKEESGVSLIEVVIAIGIISILVVGFLAALRGGMQILSFTDERQTAVSLAESQMESVKMEPFLTSYTPVPVPTESEYAGYSVNITAASVSTRDTYIQDVKITVSHRGKAIIMAPNCTLESFKVSR